MKLISPLKTVLFAGAALTVLSASAFADLPGKHPGYLHALSDLRAARWLLEHRPGDAAVSGQEDVAIQQIDAAINDIKKAAVDDGKNLHDHPKVQEPAGHTGRLHKAKEILEKVRSDIGGEEDDPTSQGLKKRSIAHVHDAIDATKRALADDHK